MMTRINVFHIVELLCIAWSVPAAAVTILQPNGGENILAGSHYEIRWTCDPGGAAVDIRFQYTPGAEWSTVAENVPCTDGAGSFNWHVQNVSSSDCRIRIATHGAAVSTDESDAPFTVYPCALPMDFNADCLIDLADLAVFGARWLACGNPYDAACLGNHPPAITSTPPTTAEAGTEYTYQLTAADPDSDDAPQLSFLLPAAPPAMTVDGAGRITWTPAALDEGLHTVVAAVSDPSGAADYQAFEINVTLPAVTWQNTGAPVDGFPSLKERRALVYTNAARMAPQAYRDKYMADWNPSASGILQAANHPAVDPVYHSTDLIQSARYHSDDMVANCGLQHDSCDGTPWYTRIYSFHDCTVGFGIGENVAYGYTEARKTINQFLCDRTAGQCAADGTAAAGHRDNIMNAGWTRIGHGYSDPYWWTQDFSSCPLPSRPAIVAACHDFIDNGKTTFLLNYFDETGSAPLFVRVVVDGLAHDMPLDIGQPHRGTYRLDLETQPVCREYYFQAATPSGQGFRCPGPGSFMTVGEGTCTEDYKQP